MWKTGRLLYRLTWTVIEQRLIAVNAGDWLLRLSEGLDAG